MKRYFYITTHFLPEYEGIVFEKYQDDLYINTETGEIYRKRLLYDFGWGQENGFELVPQLDFSNLIQLIECPMELHRRKFRRVYTKEQFQQIDIWRSNLYGAVSVVMQDYVEELITFLADKIDTNYFSNPVIRMNFKCFCFDSRRTRAEGNIPGGVRERSYEEVLKDHPQWNSISGKVINQVYG